MGMDSDGRDDGDGDGNDCDGDDDDGNDDDLETDCPARTKTSSKSMHQVRPPRTTDEDNVHTSRSPSSSVEKMWRTIDSWSEVISV